MSMSMHVVGFRAPGDTWTKMKAVWDACKVPNIPVPQSVDQFFGGEAPHELDSTEDYAVGFPVDAIPCSWFGDDVALNKYGPQCWVIKEELFAKHCASREIAFEPPTVHTVAWTEYVCRAFALCGLEYRCPMYVTIAGTPGPWLSFRPPVPARLEEFVVAGHHRAQP